MAESAIGVGSYQFNKQAEVIPVASTYGNHMSEEVFIQSVDRMNEGARNTTSQKASFNHP